MLISSNPPLLSYNLHLSAVDAAWSGITNNHSLCTFNSSCFRLLIAIRVELQVSSEP